MAMSRWCRCYWISEQGTTSPVLHWIRVMPTPIVARYMYLILQPVSQTIDQTYHPHEAVKREDVTNFVHFDDSNATKALTRAFYSWVCSFAA